MMRGFMLNRILIEPHVFCEKGETLCGDVALLALDERALVPDIADKSAMLNYTVVGGRDRWQRLFLDVSLRGSLKLICQRCMQAMPFEVDETAHIVLFDDEAGLDAAMLADAELEGMLLQTEMDVGSILEDQLILALPFSPMHDVCDNADLDAANRNKPNPFAVLAGLKKSDET